jgi:hypothetical protein
VHLLNKENENKDSIYPYHIFNVILDFKCPAVE